LERANRDWSASAAHLAPDGDVDVHDQLIETFTPPECPVCRVCSLMPDVVFFGDSVPRTVVDECFDALRRSTATLVLGSTLQVNTNRIAPLVSLQVMSSYRFVRECKQQHKPVYIVNIGETRADAVADYKIESKCSDVLQRLRF
jgi:NAD-dependent SIR2 family protein deacetylase